MTYSLIRIGSKKMWMAQPSNWAELRYTLHEEPEGLLDYDPNNIEPDYELLNMFLE